MVALHQFKTLHSVQRHGGIHAAARSLHLSPSAVSQQIKTLSSECGFPLIEQDGRGIRLTERGQAVAQLGKQIAELWERSISGGNADNGDRRPTAPVRLGAFPSALSHCVIPALRSGEPLPHPLELFETTPSEGRDLVIQGDLDAAVSTWDSGGDAHPGLAMAPLRHDPFVLVGPHAYLASVIRTHAAQSLSGLPWVLPRAGSDCDRLIGEHPVRHHILVHAVGRTDDWVLAQEMAATLYAVAYVPVTALTQHGDLARMIDIGGIPGPARTTVFLARSTAAGNSWFAALHQRLARAYRRTTGLASSVESIIAGS